MTFLGILGIILGMAGLIFLAYKNFNMILFTPICAVVIAVLNGMNPVEAITDTYLGGFWLMFSNMFFVFILGMIFAEIYQKSGAALAISNAIYKAATGKQRKQAAAGQTVRLSPFIGIGIIYIICVALAYGGLSALVITMVTAPIVFDIFRKCDMPNEMIPGTILGAVAAGVPSLPGTASDQNVIASSFLGTNAMVEPVVGFICGITVLVLNYLVMSFLGRRKVANGQTFVMPADMEQVDFDTKGPHWALALLPMILIFVLYNVVRLHIVACLALGCVLAIILFWPYLGGLSAIVEFATAATGRGAMVGVASASLSGIGTVIAATPAFPTLCDALIGISLPPMFKAAISIMLLTAVGGSGPAGLSVALPNLGPTFTTMGINVERLHRVAVFASQTLDTLPTNPALPVTNEMLHTNMHDSYKYICITTVGMTTVGTLLAALLFTIL